MDVINFLLLFAAIENAAGSTPISFPNASENINNTGRNDPDQNVESTELKKIVDNLFFVFLIMIMLSVGCEITIDEIWHHIRRPIGIGIGMFSQFVVMPLSAFTLTKLIPMKPLHATGVLIISCCPGGPLSNGFAYFCDGDLSLSVAMTSLSTLMAMGVMPLNLWIYGRNSETDGLVVPYDKLAISLACVTSPVVVGMIIRWKAPKVACYVTKVGSYLSMALVLICMILEVIVFPSMFTGVPGNLFGAVLSLPLIGFFLGYVAALILRRNRKVRKTVAFECGLQNVPTAFTVIKLSFDEKYQKDLILLPWLYFFSMTGGGTLLCIIYQIYKKWTNRKEEKAEKHVEDLNGEICREAMPETLMLENNGNVYVKLAG